MDPASPLDLASSPAEVARRVRGLTGVPWRRLLGYLRPHLAPFGIAIGGLVLGSGLALMVPLVAVHIAVIFYAGHGLEIGGNNYLIPIDAKLANDRDADDEAVGIVSAALPGHVCVASPSGRPELDDGAKCAATHVFYSNLVMKIIPDSGVPSGARGRRLKWRETAPGRSICDARPGAAR